MGHRHSINRRRLFGLGLEHRLGDVGEPGCHVIAGRQLGLPGMISTGATVRVGRHGRTLTAICRVGIGDAPCTVRTADGLPQIHTGRITVVRVGIRTSILDGTRGVLTEEGDPVAGGAGTGYDRRQGGGVGNRAVLADRLSTNRVDCRILRAWNIIAVEGRVDGPTLGYHIVDLVLAHGIRDSLGSIRLVVERILGRLGLLDALSGIGSLVGGVQGGHAPLQEGVIRIGGIGRRLGGIRLVGGDGPGDQLEVPVQPLVLLGLGEVDGAIIDRHLATRGIQGVSLCRGRGTIQEELVGPVCKATITTQGGYGVESRAGHGEIPLIARVVGHRVLVHPDRMGRQGINRNPLVVFQTQPLVVEAGIPGAVRHGHPRCPGSVGLLRCISGIVRGVVPVNEERIGRGHTRWNGIFRLAIVVEPDIVGGPVPSEGGPIKSEIGHQAPIGLVLTP